MPRRGQKARLRPRAWFRARRLRSALVGYSVYTPPNMQNEIALSRDKAKENFDYFLQRRALRLQCLRDLLKKFEVDASTDDNGLAAVSAWFDRYGGLLLHFQPYDTSTLNAFISYAPPWTGEHLGINVVWDIGIYVGECIIARRRSARWDLDTGDPDPVSLEAIGYQRPCVAGLCWPSSCDPITQIFMDSQWMTRRNHLGYPRGVVLRKSLTELVAIWSRANPPNPTRG
jgi:hypothetical protein